MTCLLKRNRIFNCLRRVFCLFVCLFVCSLSYLSFLLLLLLFFWFLFYPLQKFPFIASPSHKIMLKTSGGLFVKTSEEVSQ